MLSAIYENRIPVFLDLCPSDADFSQYSGEITLRKTKKKKPTCGSDTIAPEHKAKAISCLSYFSSVVLLVTLC